MTFNLAIRRYFYDISKYLWSLTCLFYIYFLIFFWFGGDEYNPIEIEKNLWDIFYYLESG